jgi:PAS domain S-box-containing protein
MSKDIGAENPSSHDELASLHSELATLRAELEVRRAISSWDDGEHWLTMLADSLPQIVWVTRPDGYHLYYNRHWFEYSGLTFDEAKGTGWSRLLHPDDLQRSIDRWTLALQTGQPYEIEYRFKRASDGVYRWFLGRALPVKNERQEIVQWFGTCTDIDDRKRAEENLRLASAEKDQFLAMVSHELRTPLSAILGYAQLLQFDMLTADERKKAIASIENNAKAQAQLIEDMLDVSRIISGKLKIEPRVIDLKRVVRASIASVEPAAAGREIVVESEFADDDCYVNADAARLQQVIGNLLTNAIKFSSDGGRVRVRVQCGNLSHTLEVADQGHGIAPDFLPHVFERFRQGDSSSTRQHAGLGLGLAISRHLVDMHGGTLTAMSEGLGKGATFVVSFPKPAILPESLPQNSDRASTTKTLASLGRIKVMVVDDEPSVRGVLETTIKKCGAKVRTAASATEALKLIEEETPDVLICDLAMPEIDGFGLIAEVRKREVLSKKRIPAIALTAYASSEDRSQALAAGFDVHLSKPVEPIHLIAAIAELSSHL